VLVKNKNPYAEYIQEIKAITLLGPELEEQQHQNLVDVSGSAKQYIEIQYQC
jgi:hypothetical protein